MKPTETGTDRAAEGGLSEAAEKFARNRPGKIPMLSEELPYCNDHCMHCGVAEIMENAQEYPLERILRHLHQLRLHSPGRVMFGVSELTVRDDFLQIFKGASRLGFSTIALVTNARRFSTEGVAARARDAGLTHALVSVYGANARIHESLTRTPGSFTQTMAGLEALDRVGIRVMTNTVVTRRNVDVLTETIRFLGSRGIRRACLSYVQKIGNAKRFATQLIPGWEAAVPAMKQAFLEGESLGMIMGLGGIPQCLFPERPDAFGVDDLSYIFNAERHDQITSRSPYAWPTPCLSCGERVVCAGVQEEALHDENLELLNPERGPYKTVRVTSKLGAAMFPDLFSALSSAH